MAILPTVNHICPWIVDFIGNLHIYILNIFNTIAWDNSLFLNLLLFLNILEYFKIFFLLCESQTMYFCVVLPIHHLF